MVLKNGVVYGGNFEPLQTDVVIRGEKITAIGKADTDTDVLDLSGYTVIPGLVDIHIHGCGGADACEATPQALETMSRCLVERGITSFCPTSLTLSFEDLKKIFINVYENKEKVTGAYIQGINMEGPYIAFSKKGAQNGNFVRNPDPKEFRTLYEACHGEIKIVDIAPECEGAEAFIREVQPYCPVSIAHTDADYDQATEAIGWGVRHATHLYNAMSGLTHRAPGVVGAVFDKAQTDGVRGELICDGFHIHPAALRIAFRQLGEDGAVIVSDSMCAAGYMDGVYDLGGQPVYVKDGKARLADGTVAASTSNLYEELKNVLSFGIPMKNALKAATINPARAIRAQDTVGSIEVGKNADLLVLDKDFAIQMVIVKGKVKINHLA